MSLKEKISDDLKSAMKAGAKLRLETLRTLRAALMEKEIELRGAGVSMAAEHEVSVISTAAKKRRESIEQFTAGGRPELAEQENAELQIILEYLPKQLSEEDIRIVVTRIAGEIGASVAADFSRLMPLAMKELKGKADGKIVQESVKKHLGM